MLMMVSFFFALSFFFFDFLIIFLYLVGGTLLLFFGGFGTFGGPFFFDAISFFLFFLSLVILVASLFSGLVDYWSSNFFSSFYFFLASLFFFVFCSFLSVSVFFFYISFELVFVLMFLFVLGWGYSPERLQASLYMVFYTLVVSFPFLVGFLMGGMESLYFLGVPLWHGGWWPVYLSVFLVKLPVYGVHLWLPKAHVEAPLVGSMLLAGVLLKLGGYGILRMGGGLPSLSLNSGFLVSVGLVGGAISCFLCLRQPDLKGYVAYSSVCHMGFMLAGLASGLGLGSVGSVSMMVSHGFASSGLFFLLFSFYERFFSRSVVVLKGMGSGFLMLGFFWFLLLVLNMGVPPFLSFFSEVFVLSSLSGAWAGNFFFCGMILFFGGCYSIFLYVVCFHGAMSNTPVLSLLVSGREYTVFFFHSVFLILCVVFLGAFL